MLSTTFDEFQMRRNLHEIPSLILFKELDNVC